jgi:hypothetical protein
MKNYLDRYKDAATFFELSRLEKEKLIEKMALRLLSEKVKDILGIKQDQENNNER